MPPIDLWISTDALTKGWGATYQEISTSGPWSQEEQKAHTNVLELKVVHLTILTLTKFQIVQRIHTQQNSFELPGKDGETYNKDLLGLSKQMCDYLQLKKITIFAEYLPGHLNVAADWKFSNFQDKSDWKLSPKVFAKICQKLRNS